MPNTDDQPGTSSTNRPTAGTAMQVSSPDHERLPMYSGGDGLERLLTAIDSYVQIHNIQDDAAAAILINKLEGVPYKIIAMHREATGEDPSYDELKARLRSPNLTDKKPRLNPFASDGLLSLRAEPNETPAYLFLRVTTHCLPKAQAKIMGAADNVVPDDWPASAKECRIHSRQLRDRIFATVCPQHWRPTLSTVDFTKSTADIFRELSQFDSLVTQTPIDAVNRSNYGNNQGNRRNNNNNATTTATTTPATTTPATTTMATTTMATTTTTTMVITTTAKVEAPNATAPGAQTSVSGQRSCTAPDVNNGASTHATTAATPAVK